MTSLTVGLVGNPNCGKTTLFNALTDSKQRVGNWPGVTVERKSGFFQENTTTVEVVDLPGIYSLVMASDTVSLDEKIACDYILENNVDVIVNVIDASNLERNLYLTLQLIEMQIPVIVVLNMMDIVNKQGIKISLEVLKTHLRCLVIPIEAHKEKGIKELKTRISQIQKEVLPSYQATSQIDFHINKLTADIQKTLAEKYRARASWIAIRLLENDVYAEMLVSEDIRNQALQYKKTIHQEFAEDADILVAERRYQFISQLISLALKKSTKTILTRTAQLDRILLNRFLGIPLFLSIMYCMFLFAINIGGAFQDFFDIGSNTLFVEGLGHGLRHLGAPNWLTAILANGIGKGLNTTLTFIPVIGAMFLFLAILEDSGYMARAAFVVDRIMRVLGLPGKSFVPMIVGFGCNVPAVMATRTLENKRDRILTIMMMPFMSCGARLAIYAVFTAAFFPVGGQNIVFVLYLSGIAMAMLTGFVLRKTVLQGNPAPLIMELPPYRVPRLKTISLQTWQRLKGFLFRAGKLIVPICVLLGFLTNLHGDGTLSSGEGDTDSLLAIVGRFFTPIFSPMGIHQDNWPATVGLVTGVLAKEVVIGTLNALYMQVGHLATLHASGFNLWSGLHDAIISIPTNLSQLGSSFSNPVLAIAPVHTVSQSVYGEMYRRFDGQIGAMAYLLFVMLYFPCVSTTAAMVRELNRSWAIFSVLWTTGLAYCVAVLFYQAATFNQHSVFSCYWIVGIILFITLTFISVKSVMQPVKKLLPSGEVT